jgi:DNA-binding CsgD family transcriptional regulator
MDAGLIGREDEVSSIQAFLAEVENGPAVLVISGEPGIGKTMLWQAGVQQARERSGRVLAWSGVEAEASLSFAALSDLVAPVLEEAAAFLLPLRRHALEVALLRAGPGPRPPEPRLIGLALLDVLQLVAQQGPVVVAVDDLQWIDSASAAVLQIGLRRLRDERVGVLATLRQAADITTPLELPGPLRTQLLSLGPLGRQALHDLLRHRLGLDLARPELIRVQETSAGNPLFALELARELQRRGTRPESGKPLPVPGSLEALLGGRLARLPELARNVLLVAAAAARPTVDLLAVAYGGARGVEQALEAAVRKNVVVLEGDRVRFAHPLLATICYQQSSLWRRRDAHRALAAAVSDVEERARHLASAAEGPDATVAWELDNAAEHAAARGATAAAAELFDLAASLTPAADGEALRHHRFRAAELHNLAGNPERAALLFEQLLAEVPPGIARADALFGLATTRPADPSTFRRLLDEALVEAARDEARSARILGFRAQVAFVYSGPGASLHDARAALGKAERVGDPNLLAVAIARVGQVETYTLDITAGLLERGAAIEKQLDRAPDFFNSPAAMLAVRMLLRDDLEPARTILESAAATAAQRGNDAERAWVLFYLMWLEWLAGRWQHAVNYLAEAMELASQTHDVFLRPQVLNQQAFLEAYLGHVEAARTKATEALAIFEEASSEIHAIVCLSTIGHLELALGDLGSADRYLRDLPERLLALGWNEPSHPLWSDAIETLIALGEIERALGYLEQYEDLARHASRLSLASAARCRGLLAAAEGDLTTAFASFDKALGELDELPYPLERARTLLCLGSVRRKAKQRRLAREALEQALAGFEELGARLWAEKARVELKRISGRAAGSSELTDTEARVAALAAEGRSNKEIAAALFVSVHTVEAHLTRVYRKLGVRSRSELAGRLPVSVDRAAKV